VGEGTPETVKELAVQTHVLTWTAEGEVAGIFLEKFFRVLISAYWKGARMAYAKSAVPIGARELADTVEELDPPPGDTAYLVCDGDEAPGLAGDRAWHLLRFFVHHLGVVEPGHKMEAPKPTVGVACVATSRAAAKAELCRRIDDIFDVLEAEHPPADESVQ